MDADTNSLNKKGFSQAAIYGSFWVFGSFVFSKILFFIRTIILVRLLLPSDFGSMAIVMLAVSAMQLFTETGITPALIHKKNITEDTLSTAWLISAARGIFLFIVLYFCAPFIAEFYDNFQLSSLLRVLAFYFLLLGFQNIGIIIFLKELNFKKRAILTLSSDITNIIFSLIFAFVLKNVWALVIGYMAAGVTTLILSYSMQSYRPSLKFNINIARNLFHFGKYVFSASILMFLVTQGDDALVGKVLGLGALGFYALAYNLSSLPATAISYVISQVSLPVYAKIQDDLKRLEAGYLKVLKFTLLLAFPLAGGLFILAPEFVKIVYGLKWQPMINPILIMCFLGIFRSIGATMGPVFYALGKPNILNKIKIAEVLLMAIIIYPLTKRFGIAGAAFAGTLVYLLSLIMHYFYLTKLIQSLKIKIIKTIKSPFVNTLLMVSILYILKSYFFKEVELITLIFLVTCGFFSYMFLALFFDKQIFKLIRDLFIRKGVKA